MNPSPFAFSPVIGPVLFIKAEGFKSIPVRLINPVNIIRMHILKPGFKPHGFRDTQDIFNGRTDQFDLEIIRIFVIGNKPKYRKSCGAFHKGSQVTAGAPSASAPLIFFKYPDPFFQFTVRRFFNHHSSLLHDRSNAPHQACSRFFQL